MGFSAKQVQALRRSLNSRHVRTRVANGRELSYIEGWFALAEANRIFGFDAWSRETVETRCVLTREKTSLPFTRPKSASRSKQTERRSSGRAMALAKVGPTPRAKCTISRSNPPKPMPPSAP
jgi:recombination DNA repair RAD52 pathway protein